MNDDFLSKFQQPPRPEFVQSLYTSLARQANAEQEVPHTSPARRIIIALAALCLLFALTLIISPTLRAAALALVDDIMAKITVRGTTVFVSEGSVPVPTSGISESYSMIWTATTPGAIAAEYPFFASLPRWVPRGYKVQTRAALFFGSMYDETPTSALYEWKDPRGNTIQLSVMKGSCPNGPGPSQIPSSDCTLSINISVGLDSEPQVVAVNDQPAVLYKGISTLSDLSDPVRKWNPARGKVINAGTTIIWENGEKTFQLVIESTKITKKDALRLAGSIP